MKPVFCLLACLPVLAADLSVRQVILYKHGVGYFERIGSVEGDGVFLLRFKAKDMSDLLKSLTVLDLGSGSGILGIAAIKLGAAAALCADVNPDAVESARRNGMANGVDDRLQHGPS